MKYKNYSAEFWSKLNDYLKTRSEKHQKLHAVFDADGTLWDTDLGENFFHYTIDNKLVQLPKDPWEHYLNLKKVNNDPRSAYLWLAQIYQSVSFNTVQMWASNALGSLKPIPIFDDQRRLIEILLKNNVSIHVVTASITWAVIPGVRLLGLPDSSVIGVETKIENGLVTDQQEGIITYREGKVEAYKHRVNSIPFLAAGNSEGDIELLKFASDFRIAVSAANREDRLYKSELELQNIAKNLGWICHRFIQSE